MDLVMKCRLGWSLEVIRGWEIIWGVVVGSRGDVRDL